MKGYFCHDIQNIIALIVLRYRLDRLNKEYRQVFWFFVTIYDYECPNPQGRCVARFRNAKVHWLNGQLHRPLGKGPAIEVANGYKDGYKAWYYHGERHRPLGEGPTIKYTNGEQFWYYEGKLHRPLDEGPAIEYANGDKEWWFNGQKISRGL